MPKPKTEQELEVQVALSGAGVWKEAWRWKEAERMRLRRGGTVVAYANDLAYAAMRKEYARYLPARLGGTRELYEMQEAEREATEEVKVECRGGVGDIVNSEVVVGAPADWSRDVGWVYENYERVVEFKSGQSPACHFERALTPVPSEGAKALMRWAAENRSAFFKDVAGKVLTKGEGSEDKEAEADELGAEKVLEVLKRYERVVEERGEEEFA